MIPVLSRLFVLWGGMSRHPSVWKAEPLFESQDLLEFAVGNGSERHSDLSGDYAGLAIRLKDFDQPLGMSDGVGPADYAMVR